MKEFIWNVQCMLSYRKYARESKLHSHEYEWYKYLVKYDISRFFNRFKFWDREDELPF